MYIYTAFTISLFCGYVVFVSCSLSSFLSGFHLKLTCYAVFVFSSLVWSLSLPLYLPDRILHEASMAILFLPLFHSFSLCAWSVRSCVHAFLPFLHWVSVSGFCLNLPWLSSLCNPFTFFVNLSWQFLRFCMKLQQLCCLCNCHFLGESVCYFFFGISSLSVCSFHVYVIFVISSLHVSLPLLCTLWISSFSQWIFQCYDMFSVQFLHFLCGDSMAMLAVFSFLVLLYDSSMIMLLVISSLAWWKLPWICFSLEDMCSKYCR